MVDLAQYTNLVEDLVGSLGVSELGDLDGHDGAVLEGALVDLAVAAGAEEAVDGEVVCGLFYFFAAEEFRGSAAGVENAFALSG